jgi:outer membrane protein TolC
MIQKKKIIALLCAAFIWLTAAAPAPAAEPAPEGKEYTLKEVRELAAGMAPQIEQQKAEIDTARANEADAYIAAQSAQANSISSFYQMTGGTYDSSLLTSETADTLELMMMSVQSAINAHEDSRNTLKDKQNALEQLKDKVAYDAEVLYLQLIYMEDTIRITEKSLELLQKKKQITDKQYELGLTTAMSADQAAQDIRNAERQVAALKDNISAAKLQMNSYLGLPAGTPFFLAEPEFPDTPYEKDFIRVEQLALENSLTVNQLARDLDRINERADQIPGSGNSVKEHLAAAGRTMTVALSESKRSLHTVTESFFAALEQNKDKIDLLKKDLAIAEINYQISAKQYDLGLVPQIQYLSEGVNVETVKYNLRKAEFDDYQARRKIQLLQKGIIAA